jgi:hypothetical protein
MNRTTTDRPALLLVIGTFLLCALVALSSCTTARPASYSVEVGKHDYSHDARTKHSEPQPSHIR